MSSDPLCQIHIVRLKNRYLGNNVEDNVVFLGLKAFNSHSSELQIRLPAAEMRKSLF